MSALAKTVRRLVREIEFEVFEGAGRPLCDDELRDLRIAAAMLDRIVQAETDAREGEQRSAA
jgi:hypothetical protein